MDSKIQYTTPDFKPGSELNELINCIRTKISNELSDLSHIRGNIDAAHFNLKVDTFQEYCYETKSILGKYPLNQHHFLWLFAISGLISRFYNLESFFHEHFESDSRFEFERVDSKIESIGAKLGKLSGDLSELASAYFGSGNLNLDKYIDSCSLISMDRFFELVSTTLELLTFDKPEEIQNLETSLNTFRAIQSCLQKLYILIGKYEVGVQTELSGRSFSTLTQFTRVVYITGQSELLEPFMNPQLPIISPRITFQVIQSNTVYFVDIINFYKFTAFNLVALSIIKENVEYNQQANNYFKILLSLPNLNTQIYETYQFENGSEDKPKTLLDFMTKDKQESFIVSVAERQEISLLFVINYILNATRLRHVLEPEAYYKSELKYLLKSLSATLSKEIDQSASRSGSTHSSSVSFAHLTDVAHDKLLTTAKLRRINRLKLKSLSALLLHGSYKEKLNLVVQFCELLKYNDIQIAKINSSFSTVLEDHDSIIHLIGEQCDGKLLFLRAIRNISNNFTVLGINFIVEYNGWNNISENALKKWFGIHMDCLYALRDSGHLKFTVKESPDDRIIHFEACYREKRLMEEVVKTQVAISQLSNDLYATTKALK